MKSAVTHKDTILPKSITSSQGRLGKAWQHMRGLLFIRNTKNIFAPHAAQPQAHMQAHAQAHAHGRNLFGGRWLGLSCAALIFLCASCAPSKADTRGNPPLPTTVIQSGTVRIVAELARSPKEQELGLMFRKKLADGKGMLFVYGADSALAFWMKNTSVPLSVAYLASDGTIMQIDDMVPYSLASVVSLYSVRYALEVPLGYFARAGLGVGDRFEIPPLD